MSKSVFRQAVTILGFLPNLVFGVSLGVEIESPVYLLMNANTGGIIYQKKGYEQCYPASLTKIGTMLYILNTHPQLGTIYTASKNALIKVTEYDKVVNENTPPYRLETDGTMMHLQVGEKVPLKTLLEGFLVVSANDAGNVVAENMHGSIEEFTRAMNAFFQEKGYHNTQFVNPHGLHHDAHYTTPFELAKMMQEALKDPHFRTWIKLPFFVKAKTNLQQERKFSQFNRLIKQGRYFYPKALGGKTGYHRRAGYGLVAAAEFQKDTLIVVLLGAENPIARYVDAVKLFEFAFFQNKVKRKLLNAGLQNYMTKPIGAKKSIKTWIKEDVVIETFPGEDLDLEERVEFKPLSLPIKKYEPIGWVHFISRSIGPIKSVELLAANDSNPMLLHTFLNFLNKSKKALLPFTNQYALIALVCLVIALIRSRMRKS